MSHDKHRTLVEIKLLDRAVLKIIGKGNSIISQVCLYDMTCERTPRI